MPQAWDCMGPDFQSQHLELPGSSIIWAVLGIGFGLCWTWVGDPNLRRAGIRGFLVCQAVFSRGSATVTMALMEPFGLWQGLFFAENSVCWGYAWAENFLGWEPSAENVSGCDSEKGILVLWDETNVWE